jgi:hypothetical protein
MNIAIAMAVLATQFHDEGSVTIIDNLRIQWCFTILNPDQRGRTCFRCVGYKSNIEIFIFSRYFNIIGEEPFRLPVKVFSTLFG